MAVIDYKNRCAEMLMNDKLTLLELANELNNITHACKIMNCSRQHYYNIKDQQLKGSQELKPKSRAPINRPKQASKKIEEIILNYVLAHPEYGYPRIAGTLFTEKGIRINESTARGILKRHKLTTFNKRLKYLEQEQQKHGFTLSENQIQMLSRINERIESQHIYAPYTGYLLGQDTFYIGYLKGVGRIYMQSVIDCANSFAFAKLYTSKDALTAAHMLQSRVLPFYHHMDIPIQHILTDNGREYRGSENHPYELILNLFSIKHRYTKVSSPCTNGFVERFQRTVLNEFFQIKFRTKFYTSLEELQLDLDKYLVYYNFHRAHFGYRLKGKTPFAGFFSKNTSLALPCLS